MAIEMTQPQASPHTPPLLRYPSADVSLRSGRPVERELRGRPLWRQLDWRDRPMAGRCLAHLVATGRVGLEFARRRPKYPIGYLPKSQTA